MDVVATLPATDKPAKIRSFAFVIVSRDGGKSNFI
jgi:hypothetical protein